MQVIGFNDIVRSWQHGWK